MPSFPYKFCRNLLAVGLLGGTWLSLGSVSFGRIGETQPQIEKRLLADNTAIRIMTPVNMLSQVDLRRRSIRASTGGAGARNADGFDITPINELFWFAAGQPVALPNAAGVTPSPPDFFEYIYFKTDDGTAAKDKLQDPTKAVGWELHVYLYKQVSVLEVYRRIGSKIQDAEVNALLEANRGTSSWTHDSQNPAGDDTSVDLDDPAVSYIGYSARRADKEVCNAQFGNDVVFFSSSLDKRLFELRRQQLKAAQGRPAPVSPNSVKGF